MTQTEWKAGDRVWWRLYPNAEWRRGTVHRHLNHERNWWVITTGAETLDIPVLNIRVMSAIDQLGMLA